MLQLTRRADYGLRLMLEVATRRNGSVTTAAVAQRQQIPYEFLRKVVQILVSRGLLISERGAGGGLTLPYSPEAISALDIVAAFESPALNRCTVDPARCDRRDVCAAFPIWVEAQRQVERVLGEARLSDLVERQRTLESVGRDAKRTGTEGRHGDRRSAVRSAPALEPGSISAQRERSGIGGAQHVP